MSLTYGPATTFSGLVNLWHTVRICSAVSDPRTERRQPPARKLQAADRIVQIWLVVKKVLGARAECDLWYAPTADRDSIGVLTESDTVMNRPPTRQSPRGLQQSP